jgi:hypothetical protein
MSFKFDRLYTKLLVEFSEPATKKIVAKFFNDAPEEEIRREIDDFERYKNALAIKDPFQYKTWLDFTEAIHGAKGKAEFKKRNKEAVPTTRVVRRPTEKDPEALVDDENITIYKGDSEHKCVKYGNEYSFCISRPGGGNMYGNYRLEKASTFYFIYFKQTPKTDPKHIMVLDHTENGYEWTFGDNNTQSINGGWGEVVEEFPLLTPYKDLIVNEKLSRDEENTINIVQDFKYNQNLQSFNSYDYAIKTTIVKSGVSLRDEIFDTLDRDLRNEYISVGGNLTHHQAKSLKGSEINRYIKVREQTIPLLNKAKSLMINILDRETQIVKYWEFETNKRLVNRIENYTSGDFSIGGTLRQGGNWVVVIFELPPSMKSLHISGGFYCDDSNLTSLENAPRSVEGNFECSYNELTSLQGAPQKIGGNFYCSNNELTSLQGEPDSDDTNISIWGSKFAQSLKNQILGTQPVQESYNQLDLLNWAYKGLHIIK